MGAIANALDLVSTDPGALARVLGWANERYGHKAASFHGTSVRLQPAFGSQSQSVQAGVNEFAGVADLFSAAAPQTDADKALVVAYWVQERDGEAEWNSIGVNNTLKHLGHGVGNITEALDALIQQKPQLAIQTRKTGKTRQARKLYKLTTEGLKRVREMLAQAGAAEGA